MSALFQTVLSTTITPLSFFSCLAASILLGGAIAAVYMLTTKHYTSGFVVTLALIPAVVQIVIMMVNGNLGAGVAVAGAFSLIRFRSIPGTAREIGAIFIALATGLATGMGYIAISVVFTLVMLVLLFIYSRLGLGKMKREKKLLTVVIPENLNYTDVFDDIFERYTSQSELVNVKTTNMGSLFKVSYEVVLKNPKEEKDMLDLIRCRNSNLEIAINKIMENGESL